MDGQDSGDNKQSTADMTQFVQTLLQQMQTRFQTMSDSIVTKIDEMGDRINELEQSINDLRTEMGADGSPSPLSTSKKPVEPKSEEAFVSGLTRVAQALGWPRGLEEWRNKILFLHVTRTSDGSIDGLNVPRSANLLTLKEELEDSFTTLVPNTCTIRYHEVAIETDQAWRSCVLAFGETGNPCMKLSIHE